MALSENPNLALIPSGYKSGKIYSVLPTTGVGDFDFSRSGTATRINSQGLIETVADGVPRLNYPMIDGKVVGCPSHLLEPQRTNSITYSNDFSKSIYGKNNLTVTANQGTSPNGSQNASLIVPNASVSPIRYLTNNTGSNLKTNSVFLKKEGLRYVKFGNAQSVVLVDLENGTISAGSVSTNNFTIENYGNGWYRVSCYNTLDVNLQIQIVFGVDGSGSNIATNGTDGVYIYGFEIQNGSYPSSYIPTNGSIATRSAETANNSGDASTFNDSEGVLMAEVSFDKNLSYKAISISVGNINNSLRIYSTLIANQLVFRVRVGNADQMLKLITLEDISQINKLSLKYKENDFNVYVNGFKVASSNVGSVYSDGTLDRLNLDRYDGVDDFYGSAKQIQYFDSALNDSDLEKLTSWVSFSDMANGQLYTIE